MASIVVHAKLTFPIDIVAVQQEVQLSLSQNWQSHFNKRDYEGEWTVLSLKAPGGNANNIFADTMGGDGYAETSLMELFPSIKKMLTYFECETMAVRLLNLKAGAIIKEHRDNELAFEKGEARVHFPIFTNEQVEFYLDGELVKMQEGEAWYINANLPHKVNNFGTADRIHLVVDCKVNDWLTESFNQSIKKEKIVKRDKAELKQMIEALKAMNTDTSLKLADTLLLELNEN